MLKKIEAKFPNVKALVVEDFIDNQDLLKEMLELMEIEVDVVDNGVEAVEIFEDGKYDIIFMDIQMPEMNGYDCTDEIRKLNTGDKKITIIAVTANALDGDREKCLEAGMNDYISKPFRAEQIENVLSEYLTSN